MQIENHDKQNIIIWQENMNLFHNIEKFGTKVIIVLKKKIFNLSGSHFWALQKPGIHKIGIKKDISMYVFSFEMRF